jgi:hypothetical protein
MLITTATVWSDNTVLLHSGIGMQELGSWSGWGGGEFFTGVEFITRPG